MSKFKKGDRVRYTGNCLTYGIVGTVVALRKNWTCAVGVRFDDASDSLHSLDGLCKDHHGWWALEEHLELANEAMMDLEWPEGKRPKFRIGDKVIGNKKAEKYGITRMGWIGTVVGVSGETIIVEPAGGIGRYWVDSDCFDLVSRKETEKTPKKTPKKDPISGDAPRRVVIEITSEGAKAKYIYNGKVEGEARIHRWHGDKPDDAKAAKYAVDALFGTNKSGEDAEWASKTAEILNYKDWKDILFKAYCEKK